MKIALVNTNRISPPIAPIGLDYTAEALTAAGCEVRILDLCFTDNIDIAITDFFSAFDPGLIGITLRNTDDCAFAVRQSFLPSFADMVRRIRRVSDARIVVGGVGFSVMPRVVLSHADCDLGIRGEGEFVLPLLADRLDKQLPFEDLPGLVFRQDGKWRETPMHFGDLSTLPPMKRGWLDNVRYFNEGGQAGVETARGCPMPCTFCADPVAKGKTLRTRPADAVADEVAHLYRQGIDSFHTCDSEFNLKESHAHAVCDALIARGLGDKLRWYAYCTPAPFSEQTALKMRKAGCVGINFSVDHGDPSMLRRLGREFSTGDILAAADRCKRAGIAVMFDLLIGSPHESKGSIERAVSLMKRSNADRIGIALGLRVWPGTAVADTVQAPEYRKSLIGGETADVPLYYLESAVRDDIAGTVNESIGDDPRFLFFNPDDAGQNYNYADNEALETAVRNGHRGAYWDILRRISE